MEIRDKRGVENVMADHLSYLKGTRNDSDTLLIHEHFLDEQLMTIRDYTLWFADFVNFPACHVLPPDLTTQQWQEVPPWCALLSLGWSLLVSALFRSSHPALCTRRRIPRHPTPLPFRSIWGTFWGHSHNAQGITIWILLANIIQGCPFLCSELQSMPIDG